MTKINIILLGESGVGKTSVLLRFQSGEFNEQPIKPTIGAEFFIKNIMLEGNAISLFIWDTAGEERHRSVVRSYYRQGEGVLLVYDVTNPESFYKLSSWLCELRNANEKAEILIAGNKNEDPSKKTVAVSAVKNFAIEENADYMEISAKSGENVEEAFLHLARKILIAKGILTEKPEENNAGSTKELSKVSSPKKNIPDKDTDIIRLEDKPMATSSETKKRCC